MGFYLPIILIPALLVGFICKFFWPHKITLKEWGLQILGVVLSTLICFGIVTASSIGYSGDYAIFNGEVTGKDRVEVTCEHEHQCGETCRTVTERDVNGKSHSRRVCTPKYCKDHNYDVDWDVYTTLGTFTIRREDRRGLTSPARWLDVDKEDPVSSSKYVQNFMLLDDNRFTTSSVIHTRFLNKLPAYPEVYDYYKFNRIVATDGGDYDSINIWLNEQLRKDGAALELNVILVVTREDPDYFYALMEFWKGARKNDVIIVYGIDDSNTIKWTRAMSWADGQNNQILLKQLQTLGYERVLNDELVHEQYNLIKKEFKRVPNKQFEYLRDSWTPPTWVIVMMLLLNLGTAIGVAYYVIKEDVA